MYNLQSRLISVMILASFFFCCFSGIAGVTPAYAGEFKQISGRSADLYASIPDGTAIRGIPGSPKTPATERDIDYLRRKSSDRFSANILPALNSSRSFYAQDLSTGSFETVNASLKKIGAHCYIYVDQAVPVSGPGTVTDSMIDIIASRFESIYQTDVRVFGQPPDVDLDKRVNILLMDIKDAAHGDSYIAGYFDGIHELPQVFYPRQSNECEMFFMDVNEGLPDNAAAMNEFLGTLAHEFQHMIQFGTYLKNTTGGSDCYEDTWLNEGLADLAEYINFGSHPLGHVEYFLSDLFAPNGGLTQWDGELANYGAAYLFSLYMYQQFGEAFITDLAADPGTGIASINHQLIAHGKGTAFDEVFEKCQLAIAIDDSTANPGELGFAGIDLSDIRQHPICVPKGWPMFYSLSSLNPFPLSTWGGSYRSYGGFLDGERNTNALNILFTNTDGCYYIVKPTGGGAVASYADFVFAPKTIEKILPDPVNGNIVKLNSNQIALLVWIAKGSAISNPITLSEAGIPSDDSKPSTPSGLVCAENKHNSVTVAWQPSSYTGGIKGYNIYRDGAVQPLNPSPVTVTSFTDLTVSGNTAYSYKVEAVGLDSILSSKSKALAVTTPSSQGSEAPAAPSLAYVGTGVDVNDGCYIDFTLNHTPSADVDYYDVYLTSGAYQFMIPYGSTGNKRIALLDEGVIFNLYAFAVDTFGNRSEASNQLSIKTGTGPVNLPSEPANVSVSSVDLSSVTLQWDPSTSPDGILEYNIYRDDVFVGKVAGNTTPLRYTDTGLNLGTSYTYTVEAVDNSALHLNSIFSQELTATTLKKTPPMLTPMLNATVDGDISITFTDDEAWRNAITSVTADGALLIPDNQRSINGGTLTIKQGALTSSGDHTIEVHATDYYDASLTQAIEAGALSLINSSVEFVQGPEPGTTSTITLTARDQYGNPIQGYQFIMDVNVTDNLPTNELYRINNTSYTDTASGVNAGLPTDSSGQTTLTVEMPMVVDAIDGLQIQLYTSDGETAVTDPIGYIQKAPPALTAAQDATVDGNIVITFANDDDWKTEVTSVKVGATALTSPANYQFGNGTLTLKPSATAALQSAGNKTITIKAHGFADAVVVQALGAGAVSAANSTVQVSPALSAGTASTFTLTARDQYGNLVQGYQFKMDITITDTVSATDESYTAAGNTYTASAGNVNAGGATGVNGTVSFQVLLPTTIDTGDGISIRIKTSSGTTVGNAVTFTKSAPPPSGGGLGGVFPPAATPTPTPLATQTTVEPTPKPEPGEVEVTTQTIKEKLNNSDAAPISVRLTGTEEVQTAAIEAEALAMLAEKSKSISIETEEVGIILPASAIDPKAFHGDDDVLKVSVEKLSGDAVKDKLADVKAKNDGEGLYSVGGMVFEFKAQVVSKDGSEGLSSFKSDLTVSISLDGVSMKNINPEKLGVYRYNESTKSWDFVGGTYDPATKTMTFKTNHFSYYSVMTYEKTFSDILGHWARKDIEQLVARHILSGVNEDLFMPDANITRAEFAVMLARLLRLKAGTGEKVHFTDVTEEKWYYNEVVAAYQTGIIKGITADTFCPDARITREQMAAMLTRALKYCGKGTDLSQEKVDDCLAKFSDAVNISAYAKRGVAEALLNKIIAGRSSDTFMPGEPATRAEAAAMIKRFIGVAGTY